MSAYDITEFLRTAYRPYAYRLNPPEYCVPKWGGGVTLIRLPVQVKVVSQWHNTDDILTAQVLSF